MNPPNRLAYVALAVVCFFWGTTYLASSVAVQSVHGFLLGGIRQLIAGGILTGYFLLKGRPFPRGAELRHLLLTGMLMVGVSNGTMNWALQYIPSGIGAIIAATTPIWMVFFGQLLGAKTRFSVKLVVGILLGLAGITGIFGDYLAEILQPEFRFGIFLGLVSTATWCLGSILSVKRKLATHLVYGSGVQLLGAGIFMLMLSVFVGEEAVFKTPGWDFYLALAYLTVFGSVVTFSAYVYAMTHLPPARMSIYAYVNPLVAVVAGALILGEKLTWNTGLFSLVTVAGVWLVNRSKT